MTHLPPAEKVRLARELQVILSSSLLCFTPLSLSPVHFQPILEAWYAKGPLSMTSIYGVRKYSNNSILRMHVDTLSTHVVSAIINVDQEVNRPWKLLILDHQDQEHELEMAPGDMVLYESAKLLHGRPVPMDGLRYENIFIHFKPQSGWNFL
jgi:prolyl 4-hydroxylase